ARGRREGRLRGGAAVRGGRELDLRAERSCDAAAEREAETGSRLVAFARRPDAVVVDDERRRIGRRDVNVARTGSERVRQEVAQDDAQRSRSDRKRGGEIGRDLETGRPLTQLADNRI